MIDLYLRADDEAALADALPWCRDTDRDGEPVWRLSGPGWALDLIGPVVTAPPVRDGDGAVLTPAVVDGRCHANLRLLDQELAGRIPDGLAIDPPPDSPLRRWL